MRFIAAILLCLSGFFLFLVIVLFFMGPPPLPARCSGFASLGCPLDWGYYSNGSFYMFISNRIGAPLNISSIKVKCDSSYITLNGPSSLPIGGIGEYKTDDCKPIGKGKGYEFEITLNYVSNKIGYTERGILRGHIK